jgi:hypothetical protein
MNAPVIRISIGKFNTEKAALVEAKPTERKARLEGRIRAMRGSLP